MIVVMVIMSEMETVMEQKKRIFKQRWLRNNLKFVKSNMSSAKIVAIYAFILDKMNKMGTFSKQNI